MTLRATNLGEAVDVPVSRVVRSGIELAPCTDHRLPMGDALDVVGDTRSVRNMSHALGHDIVARFSPSLLPICRASPWACA